MEVIKSSSDISYVFAHGRRVNTRDVSLIVVRHAGQHDQIGRVAFIAGKKLGNAVWRNRAKRRMRALCRELGGPFEGWDVLFVARRTACSASYESMCRSLKSALGKAGIARG